MTTNNRPLSPHLDIYRWRITMLTSTLHRLSGVFLSLGMFLLVIKLVTVAVCGQEGFSETGGLAYCFWFLWTLALYYHLCNGVRHLVWDAGYGFDIEIAEKTAKWVLAAAAGLTVLTWLFI